MKLLLTGATGAGARRAFVALTDSMQTAGLAIYRVALSDPAISPIVLLQRRAMPSWASLPPNADSRTTVILHNYFLSYPSDVAKRLAEADACVWALGRTLKALREARTGEEEQKPFRFVYISGEHADQTQTTSRMWARVKGKTETDVLAFCKESPSMTAQMYRPAYFFPSAKYPDNRINQRGRIASLADTMLTPTFATLFPSFLSPIDDLAKFAVELAKGRWPYRDLFYNKDMRELVKQL